MMMPGFGSRSILAVWSAALRDQPIPMPIPFIRDWVGERYYLALLAEAYWKAGQVEEGLGVIAEALSTMSDIGCWAEAELYRLKGELLLQQGNLEAEVEQSYWQAIHISRQQHAKSLELRATVSLSRLWQAQGKRKAARTLLAEIYDWFREGFDTVDLKEARTLLQELASDGT
jgi:predicted ATPase